MHIRHLALHNFRNYARLELDLSARIHLFQGDNAQGKTNLLESIYYLATTRSPLASLDRELIRWEADQEEVIPNAQLAVQFLRHGEEHSLEASLVIEPDDSGGGTTYRRQLRHNGVNRRAMDIVGKLNVVLFLPEDIVLVSGSPGERRRYLDVTLCQIDDRYCRSLSRYNRVMSQRNALLRQIRDGTARSDELTYWDAQVARLGAYVSGRRIWAVAQLGRDTLEIQGALTGGQEALALRYENTVSGAEPAEDVLRDERTEWRHGVPDGGLLEALEEAFVDGLASRRRNEIARGVTLIGPHRDDMRFVVNGVDITVYGSRGQQRTAALALKLGEVSLMQRHVNETPVLLLDDVLSELDRHRGQFLLKSIRRAEQVLLTATTLDAFPAEFLQQGHVWHVCAGTISPHEDYGAAGLTAEGE